MTADGQGYNGSTNYQTWAMALWIDNDRASADTARNLARAVVEDYEGKGTDPEEVGRSTTGVLADALKEWQYDLMPDLEASVWSDLLSSAWGEVDWYDLARTYLESLTEEDEA